MVMIYPRISLSDFDGAIKEKQYYKLDCRHSGRKEPARIELYAKQLPYAFVWTAGDYSLYTEDMAALEASVAFHRLQCS